MSSRATEVNTSGGLSRIANTVAATGVSRASRANPIVRTMVRHLVSHTTKQGYALACSALANADPWQPDKLGDLDVDVLLLAGEEDYLVKPDAVATLAKAGSRFECQVLPAVGHWGALEAPEQVGQALASFLMVVDR